MKSVSLVTYLDPVRRTSLGAKSRELMSEWCPVKTAKGSSKFFLLIFPRSVEAVSLEDMVGEGAPRTQMTHLTQTHRKSIAQASDKNLLLIR